MYFSDKPLLNRVALFKGFLAGSLFAGFFILETSFLVKLVVLVYGLLVILDDLLPSREINDYPMLALLGLGLGFILAFLISSVISFYMYIIILITTIIYIIKIKNSYATGI